MEASLRQRDDVRRKPRDDRRRQRRDSRRSSRRRDSRSNRYDDRDSSRSPRRRSRSKRYQDKKSASSNGYRSDDDYSRRRKRRRRSPSPEDNRRPEDDRSRRRRDRRDRRNRRRGYRRRHRSYSSSGMSASLQDTPKAGIVSSSEGDENSRRNAAETTSERRPPRSPSSHDDSIGHFRGRPGTMIGNRYKTIREVGLGTFGRVVECLDLQWRGPDRRNRERDQYVAIKIVRNVKRYYDSALIEARIVQEVNRRGGRGRSHCAILHDDFTFQGHFCMVFECLGPSLYDVLKQHNYEPFPIICVQDFAIQLLEALEFLHSFRLIHTDLKIENILLQGQRLNFGGPHSRYPGNAIKIIDFGGACYDYDKKSELINTRQYRSPEVIMGTGWSMPSDMWSLGCILAELYRGELLFATHDNIEHSALIERTIGPFPRGMVKASKNNKSMDLARVAFDSFGRHLMERVLPRANAVFVQRTQTLESVIRSEDAWFLDLLRMILVIDPHERATAHECLQYLSRIRRDVVRF